VNLTRVWKRVFPLLRARLLRPGQLRVTPRATRDGPARDGGGAAASAKRCATDYA